MKILTLFDAEEKPFFLNANKFTTWFVQKDDNLDKYFINMLLDDKFGSVLTEYLGLHGYIPKYFDNIDDAKNALDDLMWQFLSVM